MSIIITGTWERKASVGHVSPGQSKTEGLNQPTSTLLGIFVPMDNACISGESH